MIQALTQDIPFCVNSLFLAGIEQQVLLVNFHDIDRKKTTKHNTTITNLQLKEGKTAYRCNAIGKNITAKVQSVNQSGRPLSFEHSLSVRILDTSAQSLERLNELKRGVFIAIIQTHNKNFEVLGYDAGLIVELIERDYTSNDGAFLVRLKTDQVKELYPPYKWHESTYNYTLYAFSHRLKQKKTFDYTFDQTFN